MTHHYTVVYTWNGFFSPVSNEADATLNLVHAGDLVKLGFGLDGDRGLGVAHRSARPRSRARPGRRTRCPPRARARPPGLAFGVASGHYTYGWQTQAAWAGQCRQFSLTLNDGTPAHTAVFMFFA